MGSVTVYEIAKCPEHGLHGKRDPRIPAGDVHRFDSDLRIQITPAVIERPQAADIGLDGFRVVNGQRPPAFPEVGNRGQHGRHGDEDVHPARS